MKQRELERIARLILAGRNGRAHREAARLFHASTIALKTQAERIEWAQEVLRKRGKRA
jgi:hypothetical protein